MAVKLLLRNSTSNRNYVDVIYGLSCEWFASAFNWLSITLSLVSFLERCRFISLCFLVSAPFFILSSMPATGFSRVCMYVSVCVCVYPCTPSHLMNCEMLLPSETNRTNFLFFFLSFCFFQTINSIIST